MDLRSALKIALKFVKKTNDTQDPFGYIQFFAGNNEGGYRGPMLSAQNGRCGVTIRLDELVPARVLPARLLRQVVAGADSGIVARAAGYGSIELLTGGALYAVSHEDLPVNDLRWAACHTGPWPGEEGFAGFFPLDMAPILRVIHAASKDKDKGNLRTIRFRPGTVEATDRSRVALSRTSGTYDGLMPAELFQGLAHAGNLYRVGPGGMTISIGDAELRWAASLPMEYPDAGDLIPDTYEGPEVIVNTAQLAKCARQCSRVSATGSVLLDIRKDFMLLASWLAPEKDGTPRAYQARMGVARHKGSPYVEGRLTVAGRSLAEAAAVVVSPRVRLQYGRPVDPLRMESAGHLECLWPMLM